MVRGTHLDPSSIPNSSQEREMYPSCWNDTQDASVQSSGNDLRDSSSRVFIPKGTLAAALDRDTTPVSHYYSVDDIGCYDDISAVSDMGYDHDSIRRMYFYGQLADAVKRSIWWSVTSILVSHLTKNYHAIPATRILFNVSIMFCSLFSDLVAEVSCFFDIPTSNPSADDDCEGVIKLHCNISFIYLDDLGSWIVLFV